MLAPGKIQMEIQEFVNGVGATPVTLYDGAIANLPGTCMVVPASSINLIGTMRAVNLTNLGFRLGGKYSAEWRRIHAAGWHNG